MGCVFGCARRKRAKQPQPEAPKPVLIGQPSGLDSLGKTSSANGRTPRLSPRNSLVDDEDQYFDARSQRSETSTSGASPVSTPDVTRRNSLQRDPDHQGSGALDDGSPSSPGHNSLASIWSRISSGGLGGSKRRNQDGSSDLVHPDQGDDADADPRSPPSDAIAVLEPGGDKAKVGCMQLFSHSSLGHKRYLRTVRPLAGTSFKHKDLAAALDAGTERECWEASDATTFMVRSQDYMRTRIKEPSAPALYRLLNVDIYSFDFKLNHIARHVKLPEAPRLGPEALALPPDQQLPPLLIINIQIPTYPASLFGAQDGEGHSIVYYFGLPEGWQPSDVENKAALALLQRFIHDGKEADRTPTRDRLKLIPRVVNVEEWTRVGPLNVAENRLLTKYNDKPLMTKPQHVHFTGPNYHEVDLNIHGYAYIARKAFGSFIPRLGPVVFENAFAIQGNREEELPEVILGCARVTRVDFTKVRPFPALQRTPSSTLRDAALDNQV
ncbi:hypothetical protein WJX72_001980 [[Myrmecia] bisecta]|uniref:Protein ENHANCED DISEASE RESISTANCE 2 C-terminal domain-containing protein n=1 Tax=[Myrmecia] bisecta TaxID=41462 RepID=A0AAW1PKS7_9CHLO